MLIKTIIRIISLFVLLFGILNLALLVFGGFSFVFLFNAGLGIGGGIWGFRLTHTGRLLIVSLCLIYTLVLGLSIFFSILSIAQQAASKEELIFQYVLTVPLFLILLSICVFLNNSLIIEHFEKENAIQPKNDDSSFKNQCQDTENK